MLKPTEALEIVHLFCKNGSHFAGVCTPDGYRFYAWGPNDFDRIREEILTDPELDDEQVDNLMASVNHHALFTNFFPFGQADA